MKKTTIIILLLFLPVQIFAAFYEIPEFGEINGICGAGTVGSLGKAESIYYNPAGLFEVKTKEFLSSYTKHIITEAVDITFYNLGYVWPISFNIATTRKKITNSKKLRYILPVKLALGLGLYGLAVNENLYKENVYYLSLGSGVKYKHVGFSYGITAKILSLKYGSDIYTTKDPVFEKTSGKNVFNLDAGVIYKANRNLIFGVSVVNLLTANVGIKDDEILKPGFNFGYGYRIYNTEFLFEVKYREKLQDYIFGLRQGLFENKLYVSTGINSSSFNLSFKYKIHLQGFIVEPIYSFCYPYQLISYGSHNLTLKVKF